MKSTPNHVRFRRRVNETSPRRKRPIVLILTAVFLAYAGLIPLPHLIMEGKDVGLFSKMLIALTLMACAILLLPGRLRVAFHLTRLTLAAWLLSALISLWEVMHGSPVSLTGAKVAADPGKIVMAIGAVLVGLLFYFFSFGRKSRAYYGLDDAALKADGG